MSEQVERLNELDTSIGAATRFKTNRNNFAILCSGCNQLFYVDEHTYNRAMSDLAFDPADSPFYCNDCEAEYASEER